MNVFKQSLIALLLLSPLVQAVHAQNYPLRPVRIIVGFPRAARRTSSRG